MKLIIISILLIFSSAFSSSGQRIDFIKEFGISGYEDVRSIVNLDNHKIAFTGLCKTANDPEGDVYLSVMDQSGNVLGTKYYGKEKEDGGNGLIKTADGGLLISGHTASPLIGNECDALVTKINASGGMEWQVNLGGELDETSYHAIEMLDGSLWVVGTSTNEQTKISDGVLFHINSDGKLIETILTSITYTSAHGGFSKRINKRANRLIQSNDKVILIAGISPYFASSSNDNNGHSDESHLWILNLDSSKILKEVSISDKSPKMYDIVLDKNHERVLFFGINNISYSAIDSLTKGKIWMYSINSVNFNLDTSFKSPFQNFGDGTILEAKINSEGKIYFVGELYETRDTIPLWGVLDKDYKLEKWGKLEFKGNASATCLALGDQNDFYIAGKSWKGDESQMFISHIHPFEITSVSNTKTNNPVIYPNPCKNYFTLDFGDTNHKIKFELFAKNGQRVLELSFTGGINTIILPNINSGEYLYKAYNLNTHLRISGTLNVIR